MKKKSLLGLLAAMIFSIGVFADCSNNKVEVKTVSITKIVSTSNGDVTIPTNPKRIVDISGATEDLLILKHIPVGTANADSYKTTEKPSYLKTKLSTSKNERII